MTNAFENCFIESKIETKNVKALYIGQEMLAITNFLTDTTQ